MASRTSQNPMTVFKYAGVSTLDQNTDLQKKALKEAYPTGTYRQEKITGSSMVNRAMLKLILHMVSPANKLVVWKLDRLGRNLFDLIGTVKTLNQKGAALEILEQKIDSCTSIGKAFLQMLGALAEFETNFRKERQVVGIAAVKAEGKHLGRKALLTDKQKQEIREKAKAGMNPTELFKRV